jgi:Uma2 family endonuclease
MAVAPALRFTYEDYLLLPEERRYEILDGELLLTPAPTPYHQLVAGNLYALLRDEVRKLQAGQVLIAPVDVVLSRTDVLQPDILFVATDRLSIIGEKNVSAAPDLVVEVLSPATAERDRAVKAKLYARFGVREMWIADPDSKTVEVLVATGEGFRSETRFSGSEVLTTRLLSGLRIPLDQVF